MRRCDPLLPRPPGLHDPLNLGAARMPCRLTPNGKLDRAALPAPDVVAPKEQAFAAPQTPLEASLASIWADVLQLDRVSRDSDLFSLGANSIRLFQIAARTNRQGIRLSARQLLDHRTIAALAAALETEAKLALTPGQAPASCGA